MPRSPGCGFLYNVKRGNCLHCGRDLTLPPTEEEERESEAREARRPTDIGATGDDDGEPVAMARCPDCGTALGVTGSACPRCGRDVERLTTALNEGTCISCRGTRNWLSWLLWSYCQGCGAPHCSGCMGRNFHRGWTTDSWPCGYCGQLNLVNSGPA